MKVFISWSGNMSKEIGEALRTWMPAVIQQVKPYFTPNDIEKGTRWSTDIAGELNESRIGIICLTKDNLEKPWVMFEAGALSKQLDSSSELKGPLVQFQATPFNKTEVKKLITTMNNLLEENKLESSVLTEVFDMWWPKLDKQIKAIIKKYKDNGNTTESVRDEREILEEILALTRMSAKRTKTIHRSRHNTENDIETEAFSFLARRYYELYNSQNKIKANKELQSEIEELRGVIEHICKRGLRETSDYDNTMELFEKIDERFNTTDS